MGTAAWCSACGQHVWVTAEGGCANGHPAAALSGHYDSETGQPVAVASSTIPAALAPEPVAQEAPVIVPAADAPAPAVDAPAQGTRLALLADMLATFSQYPDYTVVYGTDTDISIDNEIARASWGTGRKKVEYAAVMKAVEAERRATLELGGGKLEIEWRERGENANHVMMTGEAVEVFSGEVE